MQYQNKYMSAWITRNISAKPLAVEPPLSLRSSTITDGLSKPEVFLFQKLANRASVKRVNGMNEPKDHCSLAVASQYHQSPGGSASW